MPNSDTPTRGVVSTLVKYIKLLIEDTRLSIAQKVSHLFIGIAIVSVLIVLGTVATFFISIAMCKLLEMVVASVWAYLIVAGFYILILLIILIFKNALIVNPIARFVSRLIINPPKTDPNND